MISDDGFYQDYIMGPELGHGSYATVYLAKEKKNGNNSKYVAIKKMKYLNDQISRIDNEISVLYDLGTDGSNIIKLYENKCSNKFIYLVLEFCELGDLEGAMNELFPNGFPEDLIQMFL